MLNYKNRVYGRTKEIDIETLRLAFSDKKLNFISIALLFGSRALKKNHLKSDYDFACIMKNLPTQTWGAKAEAYNIIGDILGVDDCDFDIVDITQADNVTLNSIKEGYIILKGNKDEISRLFR